MGICLNIHHSDLDAIAQDHDKNCEVCLSKVLVAWLRVRPDAKWEDVIEVLKSRTMKEITLAKEIEEFVV